MIIDLEQKLRRQIAANEQPEAFFTAWRLIHLALRHFFLNKLCDEEVMRKVIESLPDSDLPTVEERTQRHSSGAETVDSIETCVLEKFAKKLNRATEMELFTKYSILITGLNLKDNIRSQSFELWDKYQTASTQARHHVAHGKMLATRASSGMSFQELTEALSQIWSSIRFQYYDDKDFKFTLLGGPLPPFVKYFYDQDAGTLTISENPDLIEPEYEDIE